MLVQLGAPEQGREALQTDDAAQVKKTDSGMEKEVVSVPATILVVSGK